MTKEKFIKYIRLIQNFQSEQDTLCVLINKLTDGFPVVTMGDCLVKGIIDLINESMNIQGDWLERWLWEDVDKVVYDNGKEISVRTAEELYDFLTEGKHD